MFELHASTTPAAPEVPARMPGSAGFLPKLRRAARATRAEDVVRARVGNPELLDRQRDLAARPIWMVLDTPEKRRIELGTPGARPGQIDLVWCPETRKLVFGVWAPRAPHSGVKTPPRLCWYQIFSIGPELDGSAAVAKAHGRAVVIDVPRRQPSAGN